MSAGDCRALQLSSSVTYEYWECEDGTTITPGSVVVANKTGTDHAWIYMGEFDSRDEVVTYLIPKALEYFSCSAKHGNINAKRMIAIEQLSGEYIPQDVNKAVEKLTELAENGDAVSAYRLGKLYLFGADGIERDVQQAVQWLTQSAEDGNEYAQQLLENMEQRESAAFASTIFGLFVSLSHAIEDDYNKNHKQLQSKVDSKIQHMIRKHKQELGIKDEYGQQTPSY